MDTMARRDFLRGAFIASAKGGLGKTNGDSQGNGQGNDVGCNPQVRIGRIPDFPVGHERFADSGRLVIQSLPEGLRARATEGGGIYYEIKPGPAGDLMVNRAEKWPANRVFSIMTGGPACLETHLEEQE